MTLTQTDLFLEDCSELKRLVSDVPDGPSAQTLYWDT